MDLPKGFGMVFISILLGAFCVYLFYLDKKGKKMQETEEGRREYYEKYTSNFVKKKHKKLGITPLTEGGKANTRVRMSKKERRKAKEKNNNI